MKKTALLFTVATAVTLLVSSPSAKAVSPMLSIIAPGDTFTFDISGFNSASGVGYVLGTAPTATFGQTQTFAAAGFNGQAYTITSSEAIGASTTVDTITITTPTNFLTSTTVNGTTITALQFDVGNANSGVTSGTANPLNYLTAVTGATSSGYIIYGTANTQFALTSTPTIITPTSLSDAEGVNYGTNAISALAIHQFTLTITYPTLALVPEPSTWAMMGLGLVAGGAVVVRRRRLAA